MLELRDVVSALRDRHGIPTSAAEKDPWRIISRDLVRYLGTEEHRKAAHRDLLERVGKRPADILAAPRSLLLEICGGPGRFALQCADALRNAAEIAIGEYDGDLRRVLALSLPAAKRALMRFPRVGEPGAERILLFTRTHPVLALESNGLRVLLRLGFGEAKKSYAGTYRAVQADAERTIDADCDARMLAFQLLREHGQSVCKRAAVEPDGCPLQTLCSGAPVAW